MLKFFKVMGKALSASYLVSGQVLFIHIGIMAVKILNSFLVFVGVPRDMDYHNIKDHLKNIKGVKAVHGLTVWCLTLEKNALAVHLAAGIQYH